MRLAAVAIALVAQASELGGDFRIFALLVLPVVLLLGVCTAIRLSDALQEDVSLVLGMNRLRRACLDITPGTSSPAASMTSPVSSRATTGTGARSRMSVTPG